MKNKNILRRPPRSYNKKTKEKKEEIEQLSKENKEKIHPMCMPLLALEISNNSNNEFIQKSASVVMNEPHRLTEKWIASLNKWTEGRLLAISMPDPDYAVGDKISLDRLVLIKIKPPNEEHQYPSSAFIFSDSIGRKYYSKSQSKTLADKKVGDILNLKGTVSGIKEGITFLKRVSASKGLAQ